VKTISEAKNIMAIADITEDFPVEFGVYDLNEFLSVHGLIENAAVSFEDKALTMSNGNQKIKYFFAETDILTQPTKDITMPNAEVGISISEKDLDQIKKAAAVLGHTELSLSGDNGVVTASVLDIKDATANTFDTVVDNDNACKEQFNFVVNIPNLKLLPGDYFVSISSKLISNWQNTNYPVQYFIALERTSSYGV
jgi:predicted DNA binding CopG/RHH family protein